MIPNNPRKLKSIRNMKILPLFAFCCLLSAWACPVWAQIAPVRDDLSHQRDAINKKIQQTNQALQKTRSTRQSLTKQVDKLQKQVRNQEQTVKGLSQELQSVLKDIEQKERLVAELYGQLQAMRAGYHTLLRQLYRAHLRQHNQFFFLTVEQAVQAYGRRRVLEQMEERRYGQALRIAEKQNRLNAELQALQAQKAEKDRLLSGKLREKESLNKELKTKDQQALQLKKQEQNLQGELARQEKARRQLNDKITALIRESIAQQKQEAFTYKPTPGSTSATAPAANQQALSGAFAAAKGRLPRPAAGSVISGFGRQVHPQYPEVFIDNNGIDIKTSAQAAVKAVFEGTVVSVFAVPGSGNAVMLRHGAYYTTYSNLATVSVQRGDTVKAQTVLGQVAKDQSGFFVLHFELWHGKAKENPALWLSK